MNITDCLKHETAVSITTSLLTHAGYRILSCGMQEAQNTDTDRKAPEFMVTSKKLEGPVPVVILFRSNLHELLLNDLKKLVNSVGKFTLVLVLRASDSPDLEDYSRHVRCGFLKLTEDGCQMIIGRDNQPAIMSLEGQTVEKVWQQMLPLEAQFPGLEASESARHAITNLVHSFG